MARHLQVPGILDDGAFDLGSGQRVAVVGPSGSGKSAFLAVLAGAVASTDPRAHLEWRDGTTLLYIDQVERGLDRGRSPRATIADWVGAARATGALVEAGVPHTSWDAPIDTLSGGERARVATALIAVRSADVLVLDEPTNDLDLPGIEALESLLTASRSAIVVASHDEAFIRALGAEVVAMEAGALVRYRGGLDGYRRGSRRIERGLDEAPEPADGAWPTGSERDGDEAPDGESDAAIDRERALAAAALEDPTRWSSRDLARWRARSATADAALIDAWERRHGGPPPAPRYRTREAGVSVIADRDGDALRVALEGGPAAVVRRIGTVAHVGPVREPDRETLPWAWRALCNGAARLATYVLPVEAVQVSSRLPLDGGPFERHEGDWWVARREVLERLEGWTGRPAARRRRRRRRRRTSSDDVPGSGR